MFDDFFNLGWPSWVTHEPTDIDDTPYNNLCWSCHNDSTAPDVNPHSSLTTSNQYGDWSIECRTCHDPHHQIQLWTYGAESFNDTGTSTSITFNTLTETGAGWTDNQYQGYTLVPNLDELSYNYRITGNTGEILTIDGYMNKREEDFEQGDFSAFSWSTGGDADWTVQNTTRHAGEYAAEAPTSLGDNQTSYLQVRLKITEAGNISFWYKVFSEPVDDYLRFLIDAQEQDRWSGEVDWTQGSYAVSSGWRTFRWEYIKGAEGSEGSDTAWIDDIIFPTKQTATEGDSFALIYGKLIKDILSTPNSGNKTVKFFNATGDNSFADGDSTYDGVCEVCHTQPTHFRNDGRGTDQLHTNISGEQAGADCIDCHLHETGFGHGGGGEGTGCGTSSSCHGLTDSHPMHVAAEGMGAPLECSGYHDEEDFQKFADGQDNLSNTTVCDNCHSPYGAFDGVGDSVIGAKPNWDAGVYQTNRTLKPGKEKWCASCHDNEPASSQPRTIILDNTYQGATYEGNWGTSTWAPGYYGTNYHYHEPGGGTDSFTWTPTITTSGEYEVFARWTEGPTRDPNATYTIYHDGGYKVEVKDQRSNGGKWISLGAYSFDGVNDYVELYGSPNNYVIADAIKIAPYLVIVDNLEGAPTGTWGTSTWAPGYYASNYHYHEPGGETDYFTWTPTIIISGEYEVFARWTDGPTRDPNAKYKIYHDGSPSPEIVYKDQRSNGGKWISLGAYSFDGVDGYVELYGAPNDYVIADAIKWQNGDVGIYAPNVAGDNSTYGFYATGHGAHGLVECLECHDASTTHIDHAHRTYASAYNNYQAGYRLVKGLVVPRPNRGDIYAYLDDFALCADCHNLYEVLGDDLTDESRTNFCRNDSPLRNGHNYHLRFTGIHFDSDWDGVLDSTENCMTCHNVHGPPNQAMIRHGELMSSYGTTDKVPGLNFCYLISLSPEVCDTEADLKDSVAGKMAWVGTQFAQNGFCNAGCHGIIKMTRTPYLGPKVLNNNAYPKNVPADGTTQVLLTALVVDHNDNVPSNGVTIDLSPIDGVVETMYDDGINGGDLTANDNIYSYNPTVPGTVACGFKNLQVTATDPDGEGECYIKLYVLAVGEIVVDNTEATCVSMWPFYTNSELFWHNGQYHEAGDGSNTATWTPTIHIAGNYKIYAWWHSEPISRASDAPYTINYDGGSETIDVDQSTYGGEWVLLATYPFAVGTSGSVVLSDDADNYVIADAIKWEMQP